MCDQKLIVNQVLHKAKIELDETGATAAAATTILLIGSSGDSADEIRSVDMIVDHPFLFVISEPQSDSIVFMGAVNKL